jgi:hypothetical protein
LNQPESDDASTPRLWSLSGNDPTRFNREDDPPERVALRILVDDDLKEYAPSWPYEFRDGDFFAIGSRPGASRKSVGSRLGAMARISLATPSGTF